MLFPLLLQGPGIESWKSALKVDTLTTDLLGTIYNSVEIFSSDKAFEESIHFCWLRKSTAFLLVLPPLLFFNYRSEVQHIGLPTFMLVKRAYCFLATAAIFSIYLSYRGEAQHIGINLKHPL